MSRNLAGLKFCDPEFSTALATDCDDFRRVPPTSVAKTLHFALLLRLILSRGIVAIDGPGPKNANDGGGLLFREANQIVVIAASSFARPGRKSAIDGGSLLFRDTNKVAVVAVQSPSLSTSVKNAINGRR